MGDGKKAFGITFYSVLIETSLLHVIHCNVAQNVIWLILQSVSFIVFVYHVILLLQNLESII